MSELLLSVAAVFLAATVPHVIIETNLWLKHRRTGSVECSDNLLTYIKAQNSNACDVPAIDYSSRDLGASDDPQAICVLLYLSGEFSRMKGQYKCNYLLTAGRQ